MTEPGVRTRLWRNGVLEREDFPFSEISDYVCQDDCLVWVGLCAPDPNRLNDLAEELSLDPLAVEDAIAHRERPKANHYETHTFLTAYALELDRDSGELRQAQLSAFVMPHALVTVQAEDWFDIETVVRRWDQNAQLNKLGGKALAYGLLDVLVDGHFDVIQALDDEVEYLEDLLFEGVPGAPRQRRSIRHPRPARSGANELQLRIFALRKALVQARRVVLPMREVLNTITRRDSLVQEELRPYFEDLYDHVLRAAEWTESLRDMVTSVFETNLSLADARLNMIMKKLTSWAAIIAIPTAITGFYGQNVPYPGFGTHWGFLTSIGIMAALVATLYTLFKRRDWL